jgi:hypothetical protein
MRNNSLILFILLGERQNARRTGEEKNSMALTSLSVVFRGVRNRHVERLTEPKSERARVPMKDGAHRVVSQAPSSAGQSNKSPRACSLDRN